VIIWALRALLGIMALVCGTAMLDLASDEVCGWLDLLPRGILRIAAAQLDPVSRESIYADEWLPELEYILRGKESRPITRLIYGIAYAGALVISARRIARRLDRGQPSRPASRLDISVQTGLDQFAAPEWASGILTKVQDPDQGFDFFFVPDSDGKEIRPWVFQTKESDWLGLGGSRPRQWPLPGQRLGGRAYWSGRSMSWPPPGQGPH
jgi:hypothetical protein